MDERLTVQPLDDIATECLSRIIGGNGANNESAAHRREHDEVEVLANLRIRTPEAHAGTATIVVRRDVLFNMTHEVGELIDIPVGVLPHPHEDGCSGVDSGEEVPVLFVPVRTEVVEDLNEGEGISELQARVIELPVVLSADRQEKFAKAEKPLNRTTRLAVAPPCIEEDNLQEHGTGAVNHIGSGHELFAAVVLMMVEDHLTELVIHRDVAADIENEAHRIVVEIVVLDFVAVRAPDGDTDVLVDVPDIRLQPDNAKYIIGVELARMDKDVDRPCGFGILEHLAESFRVLFEMLVEVNDAGNILVVSHG